MTFLKINFDGNVVDKRGGAWFVIRGLDSWLIAIRGVRLMGIIVLSAELRVAYADDPRE